jgi:hypothetical protein
MARPELKAEGGSLPNRPRHFLGLQVGRQAVPTRQQGIDVRRRHPTCSSAVAPRSTVSHSIHTPLASSTPARDPRALRADAVTRDQHHAQGGDKVHRLESTGVPRVVS